MAFDEDWFKVMKISDATSQGGDKFNFEITQNPLYTRLVYVDLFVEISLEDYPASTSAFLPIKVGIRECVPTNFTYAEIPDQVVDV